MNATVFVVEDDADTREMIGQFLELEGYHVESAGDGKQALERLGAVSGPCVILLDLMMPVMDGWQFRREQLQDETLSRIPVIVVSAAGRDGLERIDADAYLPKPIDLTVLLQRVREYCPQ